MYDQKTQMKNLVNYLSESVFDADIDNISDDLGTKTAAEEFLKRIYPRYRKNIWQHFKMSGDTIYGIEAYRTSFDCLGVDIHDGALLVGDIRGKYSDQVSLEEYLSFPFKWGSNIVVTMDAIEAGFKLSDMNLSSKDSHVVSISFGLVDITSNQLSNLLTKFIDSRMSSGSILKLSPQKGLYDCSYLSNPVLKNFDTVIHNFPSRLSSKDFNLGSIKNCTSKNLVIGGYVNILPEDMATNSFWNEGSNKDPWILLDEKGLKLDTHKEFGKQFTEFITELTKDNPNTDIYLTEYASYDSVIKHTTCVSYKSGTLQYKYYSKFDLTNI